MKWKKKTADDEARTKRKPDEEIPEEPPPEKPSLEKPSLEERVEELTEQNAALEDKWKRALADMANMRRRLGEDRRRSEEEATMRIARELLPVMDSFRLARNAEADRDSLLQGLGLVETMLEDLLERHGIQRMDSDGAQFDPAYHEALAVEERDDIGEGEIVQVHQEGYLIHDRILRAARVVVSRRPESEEAEPEKEEKSGESTTEEEASGNESDEDGSQES